MRKTERCSKKAGGLGEMPKAVFKGQRYAKAIIKWPERSYSKAGGLAEMPGAVEEGRRGAVGRQEGLKRG